MLRFDPNEYRQQLQQAIGLTTQVGLKAAQPPQIDNPYDNPNEDSYVPQDGTGGKGDSEGVNLGGVAKRIAGGLSGDAGQSGGGMPDPGVLGNLARGSSGSTAIPGIDESGAMGGQPKDPGFKFPMGENGKIDTRPADLDLTKIDPKKLEKAKTIDEVFDAAPEGEQQKYMKWWEGAYGSINQKYDAMRKQLGSYKELPEKPSKKQQFMLLLGYGAKMMSNMRAGKRGDNSGIDTFAASSDAFQYGQDAAMGNKMSREEYGLSAANIEKNRQAELKNLGTKGEAMTAAADIDFKNAQAENLRAGKTPDQIVDERGYVFNKQRDGSIKPVMRPDGKGQLRQRLPENASGKPSDFEVQKESYLEAAGYGKGGKPRKGAEYEKTLAKANDFARYGSRTKDDGDPRNELRDAARDRVNTMMRSSPDLFRDADNPEEVARRAGQMEEEEYQRSLRTNLGSSPVGRGKGPRARAPDRSEQFVRQHPEALEDFVTDYGYVPEGMEGSVTPAIKQRLGL